MRHRRLRAWQRRGQPQSCGAVYRLPLRAFRMIALGVARRLREIGHAIRRRHNRARKQAASFA
jgi:hypothetical protein